jgi:hypothetical protein
LITIRFEGLIMTSDHLTDDVGKLEDRLRALEQRFAWGVGAAGAIGLIALLSGGFTTYMLNNAEDLGGQVAALERSVGGIDGTVNQAIGRIEGAQAAAIEAIDRKAAEAIREARDAEWRSALTRLAKVETSMKTAIVGFAAPSGCPEGWRAFDEAPVLFGLDTSSLQPVVDKALARMGWIWCRQD